MAVLLGAASDLLPVTPDGSVDIQQAVIEEMAKGADEAAPDTERCPSCGSDSLDVEQSLALTFPIRFQCRCLSCAHQWERIDD